MRRIWDYIKTAFGCGDDRPTMLFRDDRGGWVEYRLEDGKLEVLRAGHGDLPREWRM